MVGVVRADRHTMGERVVEERPGDVGRVVHAMLSRDRDGGASDLDRVVGEAAGRLLASRPSERSSRTLQAAHFLVHCGDPAGARLLLRAAARVAPDHVLDDAADHFRPPGAALRRVAVVASVVLAVGLLVTAVVTAVDSDADIVVRVLVHGSVALVPMGRVAWVRHVRFAGLTLQESRLWRSLGALRPGDISDLYVLGDGRLRRATTDFRSTRAQRHPAAGEKPDISGWVGLGGVLGAVLGMVCGLVIPGLPPGTFLALMPVGAVIAALAVWAALRSSRNGRGRGR